MSSTLLKGADQALSQVNPDNSHPHPAGEPWVAFSSFLWRFSLESTDFYFFFGRCLFFFPFFPPQEWQVSGESCFWCLSANWLSAFVEADELHLGGERHLIASYQSTIKAICLTNLFIALSPTPTR